MWCNSWPRVWSFGGGVAKIIALLVDWHPEFLWSVRLVSSGPLMRLLGPMNFELGIVNNAFSSFSSDVSLLALRDFWCND
ncbi:hypothetical protein Tco_0032219 [Tanacetum coccineum]